MKNQFTLKGKEIINCKTDLIINRNLYSKGDVIYLLDGKLHRKNGPALIKYTGEKQWRINGKLHREDGPAMIQYGNQYWYLHGKIHRVDGPAMIKNGVSSWWVNGKEYDYNEFLFQPEVIAYNKNKKQEASALRAKNNKKIKAAVEHDINF